MCCSIQKTNDQRKKFFFLPKKFPLFPTYSSIFGIRRYKKGLHPAPQRGWERRCTTFQLADAVGKLESEMKV